MYLPDKIRSTVAAHSMLDGVRTLVVAVSGGADSVLMLRALREIGGDGVALHALHVRHGIGGCESVEVAQFVRAICGELGAAFAQASVDAPAEAARTGDSLEMSARALRYSELAKFARAIGADAIAVGHNANDQAETFFLRASRGAGTQGLGGIEPVSMHPCGCRVVRPMIDCTRDEIREYMRSRKFRWVDDATNGDLSYLRNCARSQVVPAFEGAFGGAAVPSLLRSMRILREENAEIIVPAARELLARAIREDGSLDCAAIASAPNALGRRAILMWLQGRGLPSERQTLLLLEKAAGLTRAAAEGSCKIQAGDGFSVIREYDHLVVRRDAENGGSRKSGRGAGFALARRGGTSGEIGGMKLRVDVAGSVGAVKSGRTLPAQTPCECAISRDAFDAAYDSGDALVLRAWEPGDRIAPIGMTGAIKISDVLINEKVPREVRGKVLVMARGGSRDVLWMPGYAVARIARVPSADAPSVRIKLESEQ